MTSSPLAVVSDFDGTIVTKDLGDEVCRRHAPRDAWEAFERDWLGGRLTLVEAQRRIWPLVKIGRDEFHAIVDEHARLREGFERFLATATARGVPFFVASSGFEDYIERVLGRLRGGVRRVFANRLDFRPEGLSPVFPLAGRYACGACDLCKGKIVDELKAEGFRVAFLGDGGSDRCGASKADEVFAVAGSSLERWLGERGIACRPFRTFDEVAAALF